jgi:hypothetical protein
MWGGEIIGVRFLDGNDGVDGFIGFFWEVLGVLHSVFGLALMDGRLTHLRTAERVMAVRSRETHVQKTCSQSWPMTFTMQTRTCDTVFARRFFILVLFSSSI